MTIASRIDAEEECKVICPDRTSGSRYVKKKSRFLKVAAFAGYNLPDDLDVRTGLPRSPFPGERNPRLISPHFPLSTYVAVHAVQKADSEGCDGNERQDKEINEHGPLP
jgi:hypothetical protein